MAQGETLGVLSAVRKAGGDARELVLKEDFWLVETVAGAIAVALAGLRMREALRENAIRDHLTGLFNRRYMEETMERELRRALRAKIPLSVVALDLDYFKRLNDTHGHDAGDAVLRTFGKLLREGFREDDVVCRSGGEEFAVIMPGALPINAARRVEALRARVNDLQIPFGTGVSLSFTFSAGVATFPQHGETAASLFHVADSALYDAKKAGRNRVVVVGDGAAAQAAAGKP
jgi:diguanylate cyclase (GGDEF)-like protein